MTKTKKTTWFLVIFGILVMASLTLAASSFLKLQSSEWVCIAQECAEFSRGEEWVTQNCRLSGTEMMCEFQLDGQNFRVPLSGIDNISRMVSCARYQCASKALLSYGE